jgi:hypothetical protein
VFKAQSVKEDWVQVNNKNSRKLKEINSNLIQIIPTTVNKYEWLLNLNKGESTNMLVKDSRTQNKSNYPQIKGKKKLLKSEKKSGHKVLIIGHSHAKKCVAELRHNLDSRYEVSGFIKPGAMTREIIRTAEDEISTLKSSNALILWAGANDISRNNTKEAQKSLTKFMNENNKVNIVLINSPQRHDLSLSSCVNNEVVKFNRQIKEIVKLYTNVELLEVDLQRKHFTRHGQHLNYRGKERVALELAKTIDQILNKVKTTPVQIKWKEDNLNYDNLEIQSKIVNPCTYEKSPKSSNCDVNKNKSDNKMKISLRTKKVPVTRSKDFYGKPCQE